MRYLPLLIFAFLIVSCQIEDDNAPSPDEAFIKYYGELTSYEASDIEVIYDATGEIAEGLVIFGSKINELGDNDYFVLRTDLQGNLIDSLSYRYENETGQDFTGDNIPDDLKGDDRSSQIHVVPGQGFIIIGTSSITQNTLGISDFQILTLGFLDNDLNLRGDTLVALASSPGNVDLDLMGNDAILLSDGNFLIAGAIELDRGGGVTDFDNYILKFNFTNGVSFEEIQGVPGAGEDDVLVRAFEKDNGNLVCIGYSNSPSLLGENGGTNGTNVYYLELSPNGTPVNFYAYGMDDPDPSDGGVFNEQVNNVIETPSGYTVVGTSTTASDQEYAFLMNLSNNGLYLNASNHLNSIYNPDLSILQTRGFGVTQALNNELLLVGKYLSFTTASEARGGEGMFVQFDQSAQVTGAESFFGLADGDDGIVDAVTLPDGKIVAVANVDFGGGVKLLSIIKLNADGSLDR
ncbi:MAG: hypothetical protein ABJG47_13600 [Ekhidna sp.]